MLARSDQSRIILLILLLVALSGCHHVNSHRAITIFPPNTDNAIHQLRISIDGKTWQPTHAWFSGHAANYLTIEFRRQNAGRIEDHLTVRIYLGDPGTYALLKSERPSYRVDSGPSYTYSGDGSYEIEKFDRQTRTYSGRYRFSMGSEEGGVREFEMALRLIYSAELAHKGEIIRSK